MKQSVIRISVAVSLAIGGLLSPAAAYADPGDNPCGIVMMFICRMLPIAPELDGDIDLTKPLPPDQTESPPPDPPAPFDDAIN